MTTPSDVHPFWKGAWKLVLGLMTLPVILFAVMILADLILTPLIYWTLCPPFPHSITPRQPMVFPE